MKPHKSLDIVSWRSQPALAMKTTQSSELFFSKQKKMREVVCFCKSGHIFQTTQFIRVCAIHACTSSHICTQKKLFVSI